MKHYSTHKLEKALKRAERHKEWLNKNQPNTTQQRNNQKEILKLLTEIEYVSPLLSLCLMRIFFHPYAQNEP